MARHRHLIKGEKMPDVAKSKFVYAVFDPEDAYSVPTFYINLDDVAGDFAGKCALEDLTVVRYALESVGGLNQPKVRYEIQKVLKT